MYIDRKDIHMLELGISQAQAQFTKLLTKTAIIIDKKLNMKKAVIMPYAEYTRLVQLASQNTKVEEGVFNQFVGALDNDFQTEDTKYHRIVD